MPVLIDPNEAPEAGSKCSEGLLIRDSAAIATYIAAKYNPAWLPSEPLRAARCAQWMAFATAEVNNSLLKARSQGRLAARCSRRGSVLCIRCHICISGAHLESVFVEHCADEH